MTCLRSDTKRTSTKVRKIIPKLEAKSKQVVKKGDSGAKGMDIHQHDACNASSRSQRYMSTVIIDNVIS